MEIVKHKAPIMPSVKMTVDTPIDPKLEKYESIKSCFSKAFLCAISAPQGKGKTSTVISLLKGPFKKAFEDVFVIIPSISLHSIDEKDNVFAALPDENIFHEFDEETMLELEKRVIENAHNKHNSLLIIDDFGSRLKDEKTPEVRILKRMSIKVRHQRCSIMLLTQNIYMMPKAMRENLSCLIFFDSGKSQNMKVIKEILPYTDEQSENLIQAFEKPHDLLAIDLRTHRVFKNFGDELIPKSKSDV